MSREPIPRNHLLGMMWFVLVVWAGMVAADIFVKTYDPPIIIYGIPTLLVGALAFIIRYRR